MKIECTVEELEKLLEIRKSTDIKLSDDFFEKIKNVTYEELNHNS